MFTRQTALRIQTSLNISGEKVPWFVQRLNEISSKPLWIWNFFSERTWNRSWPQELELASCILRELFSNVILDHFQVLVDKSIPILVDQYFSIYSLLWSKKWKELKGAGFLITWLCHCIGLVRAIKLSVLITGLLNALNFQENFASWQLQALARYPWRNHRIKEDGCQCHAGIL